MQYHKDFADLCALLNEQGVDYLIVGGYAVAFHGAPRFTGDIDLFVRPDPDQVGRMLAAVAGFGLPATNVSPIYFLEHQQILELGRFPIQVHIMTQVSGLNWNDAWEGRTPGFYGAIPVFFLGVEALMKNKEAAGRSKDIADVDALRKKRQD